MGYYYYYSYYFLLFFYFSRRFSTHTHILYISTYIPYPLHQLPLPTCLGFPEWVLKEARAGKEDPIIPPFTLVIPSNLWFTEAYLVISIFHSHSFFFFLNLAELGTSGECLTSNFNFRSPFHLWWTFLYYIIYMYIYYFIRYIYFLYIQIFF